MLNNYTQNDSRQEDFFNTFTLETERLKGHLFDHSAYAIVFFGWALGCLIYSPYEGRAFSSLINVKFIMMSWALLFSSFFGFKIINNSSKNFPHRVKSSIEYARKHTSGFFMSPTRNLYKGLGKILEKTTDRNKNLEEIQVIFVDLLLKDGIVGFIFRISLQFFLSLGLYMLALPISSRFTLASLMTANNILARYQTLYEIESLVNNEENLSNRIRFFPSLENHTQANQPIDEIAQDLNLDPLSSNPISVIMSS